MPEPLRIWTLSLLKSAFSFASGDGVGDCVIVSEGCIVASGAGVFSVSTLSLLTYMRTFHAAKTIGDIASALERHEVTAEVVRVWLDENVLANPYGFAYSAEQGGYTIPLDRRTTELLKPNDYGNDSI